MYSLTNQLKLVKEQLRKEIEMSSNRICINCTHTFVSAYTERKKCYTCEIMNQYERDNMDIFQYEAEPGSPKLVITPDPLPPPEPAPEPKKRRARRRKNELEQLLADQERYAKEKYWSGNIYRTEFPNL